MSTLQGWRKACGAIKDSTQVGLAKVNSEFKDLDVAIVKATNHVECPPKERHIRRIFAATATVRPRADVAYCIHALARRLAKTRNWTVALKTLIVIHRTLREGDSTFKEELLNYAQRGYILQISNFKDDSSPLAWDCSAWIRTYALFLEERLECFRILKYDIEAEKFTKSGHGHVKTHCKTRDLSSGALLVQMPALQLLLYRLVGCQPQGLALGNYLIQYALALVLKESFKIYCAINDGIINLVDVFFEMSRHEAVKALEIYKRAREQAENLSDFYDLCKGLELARNFQFPILRQPPPSFLATMEEYIKEAPWTVTGSSKRLEYQEKNLLTYKPEVSSPKSPEPPAEVEESPIVESQEEPETSNETDPPEEVIPATVDLLGLNEISPAAALIEESNALALAILPSDGTSNTSTPAELLGTGATGWELALVTTDTSNTTNLIGTKMAGGFDKLLLDSLYEDAEGRKQQQPQYGVQKPQYGIGLGANPFDARDPFAMSYGIAPPTNVQMAQMVQQQNQMMMMMMMQGPYQFHPPQQSMAGNPFADPLTNYSSVPCTQQSSGLL